ncbi:MAG: metallophosphoesterase [Chlamydiia bacterium]|nr:metallophosphoesterase [Chlamydiia bacterium]
MRIWAIADLHLSFGTPNKSMDPFGPGWYRHTERLEAHWRERVSAEDLVLIPGDISWALKFEQALVDLEWIHALPGTKILLRGNHDYWWGSRKRMRDQLPHSMLSIQNDALLWNGIAIGGSRMWDIPSLNFEPFLDEVEDPDVTPSTQRALSAEENKHIFERELNRLKMSLEQLDPRAELRIAMVHYPPIGPELEPTPVTEILEAYSIDICVFGHIHSAIPGTMPYGTVRGIRYCFVPCDYLDCTPLCLLELGS